MIRCRLHGQWTGHALSRGRGHGLLGQEGVGFPGQRPCSVAAGADKGPGHATVGLGDLHCHGIGDPEVALGRQTPG